MQGRGGLSSDVREGLPKQSPEDGEEPRGGRSEGRALLVEGTPSAKRSLFQAGGDDSQCGGVGRGNGRVGGGEAGASHSQVARGLVDHRKATGFLSVCEQQCDTSLIYASKRFL